MKTFLAFVAGTAIGVLASATTVGAIIAFADNGELSDIFDALLDINKL